MAYIREAWRLPDDDRYMMLEHGHGGACKDNGNERLIDEDHEVIPTPPSLDNVMKAYGFESKKQKKVTEKKKKKISDY